MIKPSSILIIMSELSNKSNSDRVIFWLSPVNFFIIYYFLSSSEIALNKSSIFA